jgi:flagellar biosynthesis protein FlhG
MSMKGIKDQTYYEILEVSTTATIKEIQKAYDHAKETFQADSLAVYSLFSEGEMREIQEAIEEAYWILTSEVSRKSYDQSHFQTVGGQPTEKSIEAQGTSREKKTSLSFTGFSYNAEDELYRGKTLKQVREKMGVELQVISQETKINIKILEGIEEEALEKLPAMVYLKGFLKSFARSIGLDPHKVVEDYLRFMDEAKKK